MKNGNQLKHYLFYFDLHISLCCALMLTNSRKPPEKCLPMIVLQVTLKRCKLTNKCEQLTLEIRVSDRYNKSKIQNTKLYICDEKLAPLAFLF